MDDTGVNSLKIGQNLFTSLQPLISLMKMKTNQIRTLDISSSPIDQQAFADGFIETIGQMSALQELTMCECIQD